MQRNIEYNFISPSPHRNSVRKVLLLECLQMRKLKEVKVRTLSDQWQISVRTMVSNFQACYRIKFIYLKDVLMSCNAEGIYLHLTRPYNNHVKQALLTTITDSLVFSTGFLKGPSLICLISIIPTLLYSLYCNWYKDRL